MPKVFPENEIKDAILVDLVNLRLTSVRVFDNNPTSPNVYISRPYRANAPGDPTEIKFLDFRLVPRVRPSLHITYSLDTAHELLTKNLLSTRRRLQQRVEKVEKLLTEISGMQPAHC